MGDLAVEFFDDFAGCALDGFGLVAEEAGGADEVFEFGQGCFGHRLRGREAAEEFGGDHVDAHVGALGGEDGGDEQFPGRAMGERALDVGVGFVESFEDGGDAARGRGRRVGISLPIFSVANLVTGIDDSCLAGRDLAEGWPGTRRRDSVPQGGLPYKG